MNYTTDIRQIIGQPTEHDVYITMLDGDFPVQGTTTFPVYLNGETYIIDIYAAGNQAEGALSCK